MRNPVPDHLAATRPRLLIFIQLGVIPLVLPPIFLYCGCVHLCCAGQTRSEEEAIPLEH